ncbi:MAG: DUF45 domain-containing protein [Helicobacteraceae bacterium]|nr:DUF45 domain-containing protein [Helicobacteraceae bacterium]
MSTFKLTINGVELTHIYNKKLKNSYIKIDENLNVIFKTPTKCINNFFMQKESWILKTLNRLEKKKPQNYDLKTHIRYLGAIREIHSDEEFNLLLKSINRSQSFLEKKHDNFYRTMAQNYIVDRTRYYAKLMNLNFNEIVFRKMKRRWGSCSSKKVLTFNTNLMKIEPEFIDYVVVHELAHLIYMNHSKSFHSEVAKILPNEKELRVAMKNII